MGAHRHEDPCWEVSCDRCGDGDGVETYQHYHYETLAEMVETVENCDWEVIDNGRGPIAFYCLDCWEEIQDQAANAEPDLR
jgi:hypothetical protein